MYNIYLVKFDGDRAVKLLEHEVGFSDVEEKEDKNAGKIFNGANWFYNPMDYVITPVEIGSSRDIRYYKHLTKTK